MFAQLVAIIAGSHLSRSKKMNRSHKWPNGKLKTTHREGSNICGVRLKPPESSNLRGGSKGIGIRRSFPGVLPVRGDQKVRPFGPARGMLLPFGPNGRALSSYPLTGWPPSILVSANFLIHINRNIETGITRHSFLLTRPLRSS